MKYSIKGNIKIVPSTILTPGNKLRLPPTDDWTSDSLIALSVISATAAGGNEDKSSVELTKAKTIIRESHSFEFRRFDNEPSFSISSKAFQNLWADFNEI